MRIHGLAIAWFLVACGPKAGSAPEAAAPAAEATEPGPAAPAAPAEIPADLTAALDRATALLEELTLAAESAGGDCSAMAASMQTVAGGPNAAAIKEVDAHPDFEAHAAAIDAEYGGRLDAIAQRLLTASEPCATDPGVGAAFDAVGLGEPPPE